ncbi:MAG: Trehalose import ATP-binding protein SugC [Gammaproteobacteria bacterium]|nr:Trehalose import ATP-binding protein SugC [Gammaproteobacteria bacterium]
MDQPLLEVDRLYHRYGEEVAVREISFDVQPGEFIGVVGPSGCGKTTTLKIIAGLIDSTSGDIRIDGRSILADPPRKRPCSLVFQNLALFPHMTVAENLAFPLESLGVAKSEREQHVREMCSLVDLADGLLARPPGQLSGGQRQRVALARSLIYDPRLLLLDEPLSSIDFQLRRQLRKMLSDLHRRIGKTFLYVTHSLEEALSLSDHVVVMKDGEILQIGTPDEIYRQPVNRFVGEFMGDANVISVRADGEAGRYYAEELGNSVQVTENAGLETGYLLLRAHEIDLTREPRWPNAVRGRVFNRYDLGGSIEYSLALEGTGFHLGCLMEKSLAAEFSPGDTVYAEWRSDSGIIVRD